MKPNAFRDQRGAVIIHVAIALLALLAFTSFVVDYGIMWVSRRQAQTAADAGALAGAIAMAFDGVGTDAVPVRQSAHTFANKHAIWGESVTDASTDVATSLDGTPFLCPDGTASCVRVDVFRGAPDRNGTIRGTALPVFFARVVGLTSQAVRATATAEAGVADASDCLKPWAVADRWVERRPTPKIWDPLDMFDRWDTKAKPPALYPDPDYYVPATTSTVGSGFNPVDDFGMQLMLKMGTDNPTDRISSGWFLAIDLPGDCKTGGDCYREHIMGCSGQSLAIGDAIDISTDTLTGAKVGPTVQGVEGTPQGGDDLGLIEQDPDAHWVKDSPGSTWVSGQPQPGRIVGSRYATSPRIVTVPLFNPDEYQATDPHGKTAIHITNIMGFFIEGVCGGGTPSFELEWYIKCAGNNGAVIGRLMTAPGLKSGDTVPIGGDSAFLKSVRLVR